MLLSIILTAIPVVIKAISDSMSSVDWGQIVQTAAEGMIEHLDNTF